MRVDAGRDPRRYVKVAVMLRKQIADGTLQPGDPLPALAALSNELGYARQTIHKGYLILVGEGQIHRVPGLGYYVR